MVFLILERIYYFLNLTFMDYSEIYDWHSGKVYKRYPQLITDILNL